MVLKVGIQPQIEAWLRYAENYQGQNLNLAQPKA